MGLGLVALADDNRVPVTTTSITGSSGSAANTALQVIVAAKANNAAAKLRALSPGAACLAFSLMIPPSPTPIIIVGILLLVGGSVNRQPEPKLNKVRIIGALALRSWGIADESAKRERRSPVAQDTHHNAHDGIG